MIKHISTPLFLGVFLETRETTLETLQQAALKREVSIPTALITNLGVLKDLLIPN